MQYSMHITFKIQEYIILVNHVVNIFKIYLHFKFSIERKITLLPNTLDSFIKYKILVRQNMIIIISYIKVCNVNHIIFQ